METAVTDVCNNFISSKFQLLFGPLEPSGNYNVPAVLTIGSLTVHFVFIG